MKSNDANDHTVYIRDNEAGPLFSADKDRCNDREKTRKIVKPEHLHSAPPMQLANGREEVNRVSCVLPPHIVRQVACQIKVAGCASYSAIEINQLAAGSLICEPRLNGGDDAAMTIFRHGDFSSSRRPINRQCVSKQRPIMPIDHRHNSKGSACG
jgi:hypothetical protein